MNDLILYASSIIKRILPLFILLFSLHFSISIIKRIFSVCSDDFVDSEDSIEYNFIYDDNIGICFIDYNDHDFIDYVKGE